jgi:hypothetical protein
MAFTFNYPNTPYYLPTTRTYDISINSTGTQPPNVIYKISNSSPTAILPLGLSINSVNGSIIGTTTFSSITTSLQNYIIDASSATLINHSTNLSIFVDFTPEFMYPLTPYILTINRSYVSTNQITPNYTFTNNVGTTYTLISSPPLTDISLNLNSTNGNISGTPDISSNLTSYTIRANNNNILYDTVIQISVAVPPTIVYPETIYVLTQGQSISIIPNQLSTNTNPLYTVNCRLPFGLRFNNRTGEISGTPTILTTTSQYTIRVSDSIGFATAKIIISVIKVFLAPPVFATEPYSPGDFITNPAVQMRRKAEILQYKQNNSKLTKQQYYSLLAKGNGPSAKRAWATQGDAFTSPNTSGLAQDENGILLCNSPSNTIYKPTSSSNVPGPVINLYLDPTVEPNGYKAPNKKRVNIGFKWPFTNGN